MEEKINIRQFKLMNGEEIIALVTQKEPDSYIIERPFVIRSNIVGGFAFLPWFPFSGQKIFKISNKHILHHVGIDEDLKHEYIRLAAGHMKPKLVEHPLNKSPEELLSDFEDYLNDMNELDEDPEPKYENNVIPFPDPKDTIH
jgi:hypothetical protein